MAPKERNDAFFKSLTKKINIINTTPDENLLNLGKITRVHGLKGEVFVSLFSTHIETSILQDQYVQIKRDLDIYLETTIQTARIHKHGIIVKLQKVSNLKQAELLKGASLFIPKHIFSSSKGEKIYLCEILDFLVEDKNRGSLGKIFAFSENGSQDLLLIKNKKNKQVEIPLISSFIIHIDFKIKKIRVDLPLNWPGLDFS